ncbi:MAG: Trm112 family protein [Ignisphaera sp.]
MRYATLDILACPMCNHFPLKLYVFKERTLVNDNVITEKPFCSIFCGFHYKYTSNINRDSIDCNSCLSRDIVWGIVVCERCRRWYPIIEGIALMYPDDIRLYTRVKIIEYLFIRRYRDRIPKEVVSNDPLKLLRDV